MDWREFVESLSAVEHELRTDPAGAYSETDFATRDSCRHAVERTAKRSSLDEREVALKAVELAAASARTLGSEDRTAHVGFYLIDEGLPELERATRMGRSATEKVQEIAGQFRLTLYLGSIFVLTLLPTVVALAVARAQGLNGWLMLGLAGLASLSSSQLAVSLVNWAVPFFVHPRILPRLDFSEEIPSRARTLVAVPTLLTSPEGIQRLHESLEIHYLANRDDHLHFALLTDFRDASQETIPEDEQLLALARQGIEALNEKYREDRSDIFLLLHRPRRWNAKERVWMGHERKRGKLEDLNALLRGSNPIERFSSVVGDTSALGQVKYVITLDTDTQLPREAARQLVATIDHPLNRPVYDVVLGRVLKGHGILQPRVATSLLSASQSWFVKLSGDEPGLDPYTRAVSDIYQDVFHEGSFIGKGIYDVDALRRTLSGRFPENLILSHDLLEGCYSRSGLASDLQFYEDYPSRYSTDAGRRHRWIRGDWQILQWLLPIVPGPNGSRVKNPISLLSRWKIFDNLRRSLVAATMVGLLLMSWAVFDFAWAWTLWVVAILVVPVFLASLVSLFRKPPDLPVFMHVVPVARSLVKHLIHSGLRFTLLPHEAYFSLDAIARTLTRMFVTHRRLLEWTTANETDLKSRLDLIGSFRANWISPALAVASAAYLATFRIEALAVAGPVLALWCFAPAISWLISRPIRQKDAGLQPDQVLFLHKLARKTWRFFEAFAGPEDNWLPPDNYQEYPVAVIAHRTSPTNIGLSLLANFAAYDFGYILAGKLLARTSAAFRTLQKLERFRGHLYNWYDTRTLAPLIPTYVSTVDSGNFIADLLVLRGGLAELIDDKIVPARQLGGLADTIDLFLEIAGAPDKRNEDRTSSPNRESLLALARLAADLRQPAKSLSLLHALLERAGRLTSIAASHFAADPPSETSIWAHELDVQVREYLEELRFIAPWLLLELLDGAVWRGGDPERFRRLTELRLRLAEIDTVPTLREVAMFHTTLLPAIDRILEELSASSSPDPKANQWFSQLREAIAEASNRATQRMEVIDGVILECAEFSDIEYDFLYDTSRNLLAIGYNVDQRRPDASFYDLLASEARLCSFVAIAQGRLPQSHWFAMGRLLTTTDGEPVLLSWSGSMFEYLMPLLVMPTYENSLLDQTCKAAVQRQIDYALQRGVPWGMSESGYNITDVHLNYQYRAFGVPGLGFKRGLADDLVVAPYAAMMALIVAPAKACDNLERMADAGFLGSYGFYEAVDFTPARVPRGQTCAVVRSFMAHHQGMGFLSLAYLLAGRPMQRRFESNPSIRATDLLLQERIPKAAPYYPHSAEVAGPERISGERESLMRVFMNPNTPMPEVNLLSNGRYHVMINNSGSGYSRWKDTAVTRWREDATSDSHGSFCYLRDLTSSQLWSTAYQPTLTSTDGYEAIFTQARAEFRRRDNGMDIHTDIAVSPEDDIELRRVKITNRSRTQRTIELTSYAEVVLTHPAADAAHPAFSNLFVQTEIDTVHDAVLCTRRPRSSKDQMPWMLHLMAAHGTTAGLTSFETDRSQFIGRGGSVASPVAMNADGPLSGSQGPVLDPIVAIRRILVIEPDETATVDVVSGIAETREAALALVEKYRDLHLADRVFDLATTHAHVMLQQLNINQSDAQLYGRLASWVIYAQAARRAPASILLKNRRGQSGLWGYGISGDLPIVLLRISDQAKIDLVRQMVHAHAFWRSKGLAVDLVIWNEDYSGYRQQLHDQIMALIAGGADAQAIERPGGIFVRRAEQMPDEDRILLQTVARVIISDSAGTLTEQIERRVRVQPPIPVFEPTIESRPASGKRGRPPARELRLDNGHGGFSPDGREYVMTTSATQRTPAPWVNVLANPQFGTVVSESGSAYTWSENAHEFRLTPWRNDPVTDASGEAFYIRDDETGRFWSPTPLPAGGAAPYVTRHGFGYSVFESVEQGVTSEMWTYVAIDAPVKFIVLRLRNDSSRSRRLSIYGYVEWVLGELRSKSLLHLTTEIDPKSGALFARNPFNSDFVERVAFMEVSELTRNFTGDRTEFLGRNGTLASPAALGRVRLSGKVGAAFDPCGAMQAQIELAEGQQREVVFILGAGRNSDEARALVQRFRGTGPARAALETVRSFWQRTVTTIQVKTPNEELNLLANGWLLYQTLACRMWARSGYYQSGGAFGFRDQLQDAMALVHAEPRLLREHLLRASAQQFREGDVQHWWHPPVGRGVRTHFSDDYLWLPLATYRYVNCTGDTGVLDERVHYLEGRPCKPEEEAYYDLPQRSEEIGTLYEHCVRAIQYGLRFGEHGLPLMGCGDWNDGMNLVGAEGKGESVWLAFFLYDLLLKFSALARRRGEALFADQCVNQAAALQENIEKHAWDGEWYRRAYFDNGTPLGSATNAECQIDSLPQSWSLLSGAGSRERSTSALNEVDRRLVQREAALIQLFTPPFDKSDLEPGYIKGYLPGVRENGGQYTHAAVWTVMAFAAARDPRTWELFSLINPLRHGSTPAAIASYKVEPYVVAADVYAVEPHVGRGGWTWYTGAAGWMYRLIIESLLGLRLEVDKLYFAPCLPVEWNSFELEYRYRDTTYEIVVTQRDAAGAVSITVDGSGQAGDAIQLIDDRRPHRVQVVIG